VVDSVLVSCTGKNGLKMDATVIMDLQCSYAIRVLFSSLRSRSEPFDFPFWLIVPEFLYA